MISGKPVPDASSGAHDGRVLDRPAPDGHAAGQPIRDIEEIIAKLEIVTKRLAYPVREDDEPLTADFTAEMS
jgi:hypothetical protein